MPGTRYPNAEGHPPSPPFKGGKERSEGGDVIPSKEGRAKTKRWGKRHRISAEGCKPDVTIVVHSYVRY